MTAIIVILWLGLALATGVAADARGRNGFAWFVVAVVISPLIALILLLAFPQRRVGPVKLCQFCRSEVAADAIVCAHCQRDIDSAETLKTRAQELDRLERRRAWRGLAVIGGFFLLMAIVAIAKSASQ